MTHVELRLVRSRTPGPADAFLVPGADPRAWVDEIRAMGLDPTRVHLHVVPRGECDASAAGVVVVPADPHPHARTSSRGLPLMRVGRRLLVPSDARLVPSCTPDETDALLAHDLQLLHPVHGLVGFDVHDALRVADLIRTAPAASAEWDAAHPGVRTATLREVRPASTPKGEEVLERGRGDVGSKSDPPAAPDERRTSAAKRLKRWFAGRVLRVTEGVPARAARRTWLNDLEDWAVRHLGAATDEERRREIARLLHLLRTDPDEGIRYALPLGGAPGRGRAAPGGTLGRRSTDFDLRRVGGGAPADPWTLAEEQRADLEQHYRAQAERAVRLGQHRRAAYILGALLGDLRGAAAALEAGGHWREAAALFRDRLKDASAAAACLERAGLLTEAVLLRLEVGDRAGAARLLRRVGRAEESDRLWRELVAERGAAGDTLGAARLLDEELRAPDEALDLVDRGWPAGGDAPARLSFALATLGRLGRADAARRWIARARDVPCEETVGVVRVLVESAGRMQDPACREAAADTVRVLVGETLRASRGPADPTLLAAVAATDRADRVLRADAGRFRGEPAPRAAAPSPRDGELRPVRVFACDGVDPSCVGVAARREGLHVLGATADRGAAELRVFDWTTGATLGSAHWSVPVLRARRPHLVVSDLPRTTLVAWPGGPRLPRRDVDVAGHVGGSVLGPGWLPDGTLGLWPGEGLSVWTLVETSDAAGLRATCHSKDGLALRTVSFPADVDAESVSFAPDGPGFWVATPTLGRTDGAGPVEWTEGPEVRDLLRAPRHLPWAMLATGAEGCVLWTRARDGGVVATPFAAGAVAPRACFLGDGRIVVAQDRSLVVYARGRECVRRVASHDVPALDVRVLVRGPRGDEVIVVAAVDVARPAAARADLGTRVLVFRVPPGPPNRSS